MDAKGAKEEGDEKGGDEGKREFTTTTGLKFFSFFFLLIHDVLLCLFACLFACLFVCLFCLFVFVGNALQ